VSEERDLEGLGALVTGATSGIGRAVAEELGRRGALVLVHGRDEARAMEVVERVKELGGDASYALADLTQQEELESLVQIVVERVGMIDILVNNAGIAWYGPTADLDVPTFERMFVANVRAPYYLVAALAPMMASRGRGSIINLGSRAGQIGRSGGAAYSGTKAALAAMTRCWAAEFSPHGVRVNLVAPGPVATEAQPPDRIGALGATTVMGRPGQAYEIAPVVAFLASPRSSYVTGAVYAVDGGSGA
jgi:NAD(P)-dependent dehydrogenase (short-subunit alcohol dehydrogenase family)